MNITELVVENKTWKKIQAIYFVYAETDSWADLKLSFWVQSNNSWL